MFNEILHAVSSPRIASTRNHLVEGFLKTPHKWMLMVDSDMVFDATDVVTLIDTAEADGHHILGGLYFGGAPDGHVFPQIYALVEGEDGHQALESPTGCGGEEGVWGDILECHATGAGFLLVSRWALETIGEKYKDMAHQWFAESGHTSEYGEDVTFCLRAIDLGIKIHVHTGVVLGHCKQAVLDDQSYAEYLGKLAHMTKEQISREQLVRAKVLTEGDVEN
tara:strand:- start:410 stop:1075 length:666 start_codon:yes stop_codon:yes gene_type:complete